MCFNVFFSTCQCYYTCMSSIGVATPRMSRRSHVTFDRGLDSFKPSSVYLLSPIPEIFHDNPNPIYKVTELQYLSLGQASYVCLSVQAGIYTVLLGLYLHLHLNPHLHLHLHPTGAMMDFSSQLTSHFTSFRFISFQFISS